MVSDAVSSSHGRQEYGTAALAPEELRRAYREVAGRREAGARRRGATPPGMRGSPPHGCALGLDRFMVALKNAGHQAVIEDETATAGGYPTVALMLTPHTPA